MPTGALYQRQNKIHGLSVPKTATIVGLGGTGFWTALFLAMSGVEELILIDPDKIEISNLNRLPLEEDYVEAFKTTAAEAFIENIRTPIRAELHEKKIETPEDCQILRGQVFCCTDNLKSQQIICAYCKKNNIPYQRIGYDGTVLNVSKAFPLSFEEATEEGGYSITPSWVVPAAVAAGLGVFSRLCQELCVMDDLGKLNIAGCSYIPEGLRETFRKEGEDSVLDDINEHIPDDYGYCGDCERGYCPDCDYIDPSNEEYGYCPDCERISPTDEEYGFCPDCNKPTEDELDEAKEESHTEGYDKGQDDAWDEAIELISTSKAKDSRLARALDEWLEHKIEELHKGTASADLVFKLTSAIQEWETIQIQSFLLKGVNHENRQFDVVEK